MVNINGVDMSHHNTQEQFLEYIRDIDTEFFILKATEGKTYQDAKFHSRAMRVQAEGKLLGAYHYARPENNLAKEDAKNFLNQVKRYKGQILLALDWEGNCWKKSEYTEWAAEWLSIVTNEMEQMPVVYTSQAYATHNNLDDLADIGYRLWVARWGFSPDIGELGKWGEPLLWQHTNTPLDRDTFYGDVEAWSDYCRGTIPTDKEENGNMYCGCCCCKAGKIDGSTR